MTDTLAQIIVKLQELLLDDGTRFTTDTCTAAIRQALKEFNLIAPVHAGTLVTPVTGQKEYELDVENALAIVDVLRQGKDVYTEEHVSLCFDGYFEDGRPYFRLRYAEPETNILIVRYTYPHTINGLDGAADSTLPDLFDVILLDGAAWQACLIRATGRIELINLNDNVADPYTSAAKHFELSFKFGVLAAGDQAFARVPDPRTWKDAWDGVF